MKVCSSRTVGRVGTSIKLAIWWVRSGATPTFASKRPERIDGELEDFRLALVLVFGCEEGAWLAVRERTNEGSCETGEISPN